ncbi:hypothetical protein M8Z33_17445 [Streptomyces sp. ZAF1911]|uniref:hypothetical protein n=1 Tax=Streptomyces sp. ZAF1911 TaxID=2944129 RepID=UPI00237C378A|nr:hypothetical protein [Streptomyces sp. ZAF1911]MDD9378407.1 hypothetical protein [Streptomyces sp. ZAF1911]
MITGYWDPVPTARRLAPPEGSRFAHFGSPMFKGVWADRNWRNVPGPFYGADTDSLMLSRDWAPAHIAYDGGYEFVFRQPVNERETEALLDGVGWELYNGYAMDGDDHWTVEGVRDWWRDRGRVREWAVETGAEWAAWDETDQYSGFYRAHAQGHRDFVAHIDDGLEAYLRGYLYWLEHRCEPKPGEALPGL